MGHETEELLERTDAAFESTQWTVLNALRAADAAVRCAAAERIAQTYWPPVYAAARRLVRTRDEAAELTQGFFSDVVFGRRLLERADPARGTLRSLIRSALKRYATDRWRSSRSRGAGRTVPLGSLDREDALRIGGDSESAFDRRWALALMEEALRRCEGHFEGNGRARHWRLFQARVLLPALHDLEPRALGEDARDCGFETAADGAAAVQTVKRRLEAILREVVGETLSDPDELAGEYRAVLSLIEGG